jgi:hypothetical protein
MDEFGASDQLIVVLHETVAAPPAAAEKDAMRPPKPEVVSGDQSWRIEFQMIVLPDMEKSLDDVEVLISSDFPDILNTSLLILATLVVHDAAREDVSQRP